MHHMPRARLVDCRTLRLLRTQPGVRMIKASRGRACQLNAGAHAASGQHLCFLHADSRCCSDVVNVVRRAASGPDSFAVVRLLAFSLVLALCVEV